MTSKDLDWPTMAQGDFALIITEKGQSTNYCLMFPSRLIYSYDNSRPGALNIQLQLPHGKVFVDAAGKMVSPFTLLQELFNHYKQHHLTQYQYRGKEVWKFRSDWEMTQAEFEELLEPYKLIDRVLPNRHLSGTGEAFIAMSPDKMSLFTLDYAYPELVDYGKVILSTSGNTNPPELARLEIPRRPKFEIYVNGMKQDGLVREGDEAFPKKIEPPYKYQKPADITVDFEKADAEGKVDRVNERINYEVKFENRKVTKKVKIELTGCENDQDLYNSLIKKLLDACLTSQSPCRDIYPKTKSASTRTLTFSVEGKDIEYKWEPKLTTVLPSNVKLSGVSELGSDSFMMSFCYEKPQSNNGRRRDEQNRNDDSKPIVQKKEVEIVPVYITTENSTDEKLLNSIRKLKVDVTLLVERSDKNDYLATFYGVRGDSDERETITIDGKEHSCYVGKIKVPLELWENKWNKQTGKKVDVESSNQKYDLSARFYEGRVIAFAKKASKLAIFWRNWGNVVSAVAILLVGGFIGTVVENDKDFWSNSKAVVAPNVPQEVPDPEVTIGDDGHVYINKKIEVTIGENGHWFINGNDMGRTPNNGIAGEKTLIGNAGRDADDPAPTGSDNVNYAALNAKSARYMELIGKAEMSFPQVDEIKKWIDDNRQHGSKIDNYGKIAVAVKDFGKCRDVLMKINAGADIDALCPQIKNVVSTISKDNLLRELRIKMQRFLYEGGKPLKKDEQIIDKIYQFSVKHPDGIRSFKELEDLKEIRVLK